MVLVHDTWCIIDRKKILVVGGLFGDVLFIALLVTTTVRGKHHAERGERR